MKSKYGVTGRQRLIIQVVNEFPGISAGDLAKVLHLDPSTLTGVLQQMSQRGLLQLQPDMRDRRRLRIQLTTKGRRMSHMAVGAIEAAVSRTLSHVSPAKLKATREVLALLADNLDRHARCRNAYRSGHFRLRDPKNHTAPAPTTCPSASRRQRRTGCAAGQSESKYLVRSGGNIILPLALVRYTFIPVTLFERQRTSSFVVHSVTRPLPPGRSIHYLWGSLAPLGRLRLFFLESTP